MSKVEDFKNCHKRFSEALEYLCSKESELKSIPGKWDKVVHNFKTKFEEPLDLAWSALTKDQQKSLAPLYLFRKVGQDQQVKKVMEVFDAKIIGVEDVA